MKRITVILSVALLTGTAGAPAVADSLGGAACCAASGLPGCADPACEAAVCAFDDFCCEAEWDEACAEVADALCDVCEADLDGDGDVGIADLLEMLAAFGVCPPPPAPCPADIDDDGDVDIADLLALLALFGL